MSVVKFPMQRLSTEQVDRLLAACARPVTKNGSLLEPYPEKAPPRWRPAISALLERSGQRTPTGRIRIPKDEWERFSKICKANVDDLNEEAEQFSRADQGPSISELKEAPLLESWALGHHTWHGYCVAGWIHDVQDKGPRMIYTYALAGIDPKGGWARTRKDWFRLGQRVGGWEYDNRGKRHQLAVFRPCGDAEVQLALQADRADVVWRFGQLEPVQPRSVKTG